MTSKLIRLGDGTLVEVEAAPGEGQQISSKRLAKTIEGTRLDSIKPILVNASKPLVAAWDEISQDAGVEQAEIEFGLSFQGEANVYITRSMATATLIVRLVLKPNEPPSS